MKMFFRYACKYGLIENDIYAECTAEKKQEICKIFELALNSYDKVNNGLHLYATNREN